MKTWYFQILCQSAGVTAGINVQLGIKSIKRKGINKQRNIESVETKGNIRSIEQSDQEIIEGWVNRKDHPRQSQSSGTAA